MSARPLDGIVVLDLSRILAGPLCAQRLADLGARVIKVESAAGDATRGFGPPFMGGESPYFMAFNRGKESISLDLKSEAGAGFVARVLEGTDVLVDNFRPGVMERLGLGRERLAELKPDLVHVSIRGYAATGPRADEPAFDLAVQAESGLMAMTGEEGGDPCRVPFSAADVAAGGFATEAVLAALFRRARSGEGARIEVPLLDATLAYSSFHAQGVLMGAAEPRALGSRHPNLAPYQAFPTADGWIVLAVATDGQWKRFVRVPGVPEAVDRPAWRRNRARTRDREELAALLSPAFRGATLREWVDRLAAADVPFGRVRQLGEALAEVRARGEGFAARRVHGTLGEMTVLGAPFRLDGEHPAAARAAPAHDEQGRALIEEFARDENERRRWLAAQRGETA